MLKIENNKFYVYEFIRLDINEPFYVGKGCGNRVNDIRGRNKWFLNILNKHGCVSRIIVDGLSEQEAYEAEVWFIYEYKHILNYPLVNMDDGGQGGASGKHNPMYGLKGELNPNFGKKRTDEFKRTQSERMKGRTKSEEHKKKLKEYCSIRNYNAENNPNYGNGEKISGGLNPSAVKIKAIDSNNNQIIFETKEAASKEYGLSMHLLNKLLGKKIDVENDFTRNKKKYIKLQGLLFEEIA